MTVQVTHDHVGIRDHSACGASPAKAFVLGVTNDIIYIEPRFVQS